MNIIDKIKKDARAAVTTADIFVSKYMNDLIGSKLRIISRDYRVAAPSLKIMYSEDSSVTACTSLKDMTINAGHEMFDGDDEARLLKVSGVLLHEMGHILFTNYTASSVWIRDMKMGMFYPSLPAVPPELEESRDKLSALAAGPLGDALANFAHDLNNVVEDGRIENFIMKYVRNARFMTKGLVKLRQETYAIMPDFEELLKKVSTGEIPKLIAMQQLILHYARFREVKDSFDPKSEIGELLVKLIPEIEIYLNETEAIVYYGALNRMLVILEETIEEYFENQVNSQDSASDLLKDLLKALSEMGQGQPQDGDNQGSDSGESESGANGQCSNSADTSGESAGTGQTASEATGDVKNDGISEGSRASAEEQAKMQAAAQEIAEQLSEALSKLAGQSVDQSKNMGEQAKGSDRGSVKRRLTGLAKVEGGKVDAPDAAIAADGSGTITHAEAEDINLNLVLDDIARKIGDAQTESLLSKEVRADYIKVSREVRDYSEIHKNCDITMYHYSDVSQQDIEAYNQIARTVAPLVKRAVKSSNFYEKDREAYTEDGLYSGSRLHAEQSYRKDGRIFSKIYDHDEPPKVAVAVRIDCSGSMNGSRMEAARRCCVFLYEYVLGMEKRYGVKIPLYIYGDNVMSGVRMYVYADDKYRTANEKYRLMKLCAGGCNRDGLPIRMAVKRLELEQPYSQKVLFNITDGQPNDHGYGGEPAFDDLRDITRYCEKKRIALAACAIGSDRSTIEDIYGANHFLNISDLNELPVRLVKILKKLLK